MKMHAYVVSAILLLFGISSWARDIDRAKYGKKLVQPQAAQFNDLRQNTVSRVRFMITNYGIFGLDVARNQGGGFWPRGSTNEYIFGGGIWFGAIKTKDGLPRKMSVISYNPNSGASWMTPGSIDDGDEADRSPEAVLKNRVYLSTDFVRANGLPRNPADGPNWPIWDSNPNDTLANRSVIKDRTRYLGFYINDVDKRNIATFPKGPAFISQEDIFTVYKDTDLRVYEIGEDAAKAEGYPLRIQVEQTVYTWGFGEYANFYFIRYNIINRSTDTLYECWMAPAFDFDLAAAPNFAAGAGNDRVSYYFQDTTLNLAYQWTNTDRGERGRRFGYVGMTFLESPAVDENGFIRRDKLYYPLSEQLGLRTFRNWVIDIDPKTTIERYDFMASGARDGDTGPGDKRFLMATGPFNMRPGDTARVVVGTIFALPVKEEADGTVEDLVNLVRRTQFAQRVYDNGFAAPEPPEPPRVTTQPLNHAIIVSWDTTSYASYDREEKGMDIMGFRIFRSRVPTQDTFDVDFRSPSAEYPGGRGPFGWKQIAEWITPSPFVMTAIMSDSSNMLSARYPWIRIFPRASKSSYRTLYPGFLSSSDVTNDSVILIRRLPNTTSEPWRSFWQPLVPQQTYSNPIRYDTLTLGIIRILPGGTLPPLPTTTTDTATMNRAMLVLWPQITSGLARLQWFQDDWVDLPWARAIIRNYLDSVTNNRTFLDLGDDNGDGVINRDEDLRRREEILNNVEYYYKVVALDEGDYVQATPIKTSISVDLLNVVQGFALAPGPYRQPSIETTYDPNQLGGLYNFRLIPKDPDRFAQLFGGHEIELEFQPSVSGFSGYNCLDTLWNNNATFYKGIYGNELIVRDKTTGKELNRYNVLYEPADCLFDNFYSDVAMLYVSPQTGQYLSFCEDMLRGANDTTLFVHPFNTSVTARGGSWTTDKPCFGGNRTIAGTFGIAFDYYIQQFGGIFRPYRIAKLSGNANTFLEFRPRRAELIPKAEPVQVNYRTLRFQRFNNGAGIYEVEFLPGGVETITTTFLRRRGIGQFDTIRRTFDASYLNVRVRNIRTYKRPLPNGDSVLVQYGDDVPHVSQALPANLSDYNQDGSVSTVPYPHPRLVPIGSFNLSAYAWKNGRYTPATWSIRDAVTARDTQAAANNSGAPVGTQGRYYLSTVTPEGDTIDFTHALLIDGATFWLDFAGKGGRNGTAAGRQTPLPPDTATATVDFRPGDKIIIETIGGPFGLPLPGAKVTFKVSDVQIPQDRLTDADLDNIVIVPNPYVITHVGQKSSYDAKIYFTRLPKECTIKIYTVAGDLIRTIRHVDQDGTFRVGMDVWDLLSDNRQRAASQGLIAVIETPNGAQTVKKFAVVVGGARILGR
ncbi:MAG: hypothetical protein RMK00_01050 [Bacteroidota bacterium]|nr:hypothetical protein [Bacteroidota bacterium]